MGLFFKKKQEPERTDDERLRNLEKINRSYTTVGVYGDPLSPTELQRRIRTAYKDMEDLIKRDRERTCPNCGAKVIE